MAYFAKLGAGNKIIKIAVVSNNIATTEQAGIDFLNNLYNSRDVWKQTYIDGSQRKNYAGIGYTYDQEKNAFIPQRPYDSWTLNETTCEWEAPVTEPDDEQRYFWNETTKQWDLDE